MMRQTLLFGCLIAFSGASLGQTRPDVTEILKKIAETYQATKEYVLEADANGREGSGHMRLAFKAPNRYRMEGSGLFSDDPAFADVLIVHDGSTVWFYLSKSNEYTSFPASDLTNDAPGDLGDLRPEAIDDFMMSRYRDADDYTGGATLLGEETIDIGGVTVDCYVLHVRTHRDPAAYTWWVDKKDSRILREDHAGSRAVFTTIKLNEPVSDDLFKFTPPPGAKKVERQP
jgi:outer membrane lipoprotein-sorting protein